MLVRRNMVDPFHVLRPLDRVGILRPRYHEAQVGRPTGGLEQQPLKYRLAVWAVGAEIAQIPSRRVLEGGVGIGIDRKIERTRRRRAVTVHQSLQGGPTREGEIDVVPGDQVRSEIFVVAPLELRQRHRSVDVVEGRDALRNGLYPTPD